MGFSELSRYKQKKLLHILYAGTLFIFYSQHQIAAYSCIICVISYRTGTKLQF
ncbi:hypothetical protein THF1C08_10071 [Vibrio jasicida]|uniref:DUF3265 domain-containing protein n=1 Tax=Vibrio jasicida TaxID=766224 RepID=A0AAU9QD77_9VIBR|nr:hypothetical protein THF1C08_10071 [Vibrio jasicida]CAH1562473.1 hypothetical protein THF1A12_10070 [Vibrio jasicida]CAH1607016.1 hypothetical protein THF5G08_30468 [Vibrio jasicida]